MTPDYLRTPADVRTKSLPVGQPSTSRDFIPGLNVGNLLSQAGSYVGLAPTADYDIFDNLTVSNREGQTIANPFQTGFGTTVPYASPTTTTALTPTDTQVTDQTQYNAMLEASQAAQTQQNTINERNAYQSQIDTIDKLLGYANTKYSQGIQSINDQYGNNQTLQDNAFTKQRLQNTQNQEKGYGEVGNFANTSMNNLNRLLQGANAGRSSVGQVLAPYMVGRSADTRRQAVTNTAGENLQNIDQSQLTTNQEIGNQKRSKLSDYENSLMTTQKDLISQKEQAQISRDMANGSTFAQAQASASGLTGQVDAKQNALAELFNKYKPDYTVKQAPALNTYQVDPAQMSSGQSQGGQSDFYLNQLKRKKELGL